MVLLHTIVTRGTWDQVLIQKNPANLFDCLLFFFRQVPVICHEREIVPHLFHIAHAGEDHDHIVRIRRKANRV